MATEKKSYTVDGKTYMATSRADAISKSKAAGQARGKKEASTPGLKGFGGFKERLKSYTIGGRTIWAASPKDAQDAADRSGTPRKGTSFYTKQREQDKAKAAKGDKKAKAELSQIEAKRARQRGPTKSDYPDRSLRGAMDVARKAGAGPGPLPGLLKKGVEAVGKRAQAGDVAMARAAGAVKSGVGAVQKAKQAGEARQGQQAASIRGAIGKSLPKPDPDVGIAGMIKRSQS